LVSVEECPCDGETDKASADDAHIMVSPHPSISLSFSLTANTGTLWCIVAVVLGRSESNVRRISPRSTAHIAGYGRSNPKFVFVLPLEPGGHPTGLDRPLNSPRVMRNSGVYKEKPSGFADRALAAHIACGLKGSLQYFGEFL
jgi:hypothetical protein